MGCLKLEHIDKGHLRKINFSSEIAIEKREIAPIFCLSEYRYGFQGQETDDEVKGKGNSYDFGARMHDPRIGRFFQVDPKAGMYSFMSPYCHAANSPILLMDENGEGPIVGYKVRSQTLEDGTLKITVSVTVYRKIILVNESSKELTTTQGKQIAGSLAQKYNSSISSAFSSDNIEDRGIFQSLRTLYTHLDEDQKLLVEVNVDLVATSYEYAPSLSDVKDFEATLVTMIDEDDMYGGESSAHGRSSGDEGNIVIADYISPVDFKDITPNHEVSFTASKVAVHELRHTDGALERYNSTESNCGLLMGRNCGPATFRMDQKTKKSIAQGYLNLAITVGGLEKGRSEYNNSKDMFKLLGNGTFIYNPFEATNVEQVKQLIEFGKMLDYR